MNGTVSVSVDIGGTFTDTVLRRGGEVFVEKTLTTHGDVLDGFFRGMGGAAGRAGITVDMIDGAVLHATTIVTNALIERKGTQAALLLTEGFTDILEIRDERRFDIYDTQIEFPKPLISRDLVFGVGERTLADGRIQKPVDPEEIASICDTLQGRGIKSIAICLLHSYRNPTNEKQVAALIRERLPSALISVSSEIASQIREYLRASTTAVNAYTVPITKPYLDRLERRLERDRIESKPLIMLSSGGVVGSATAGANPVRMIESGPAAGALGAAYASKALGINTLLAFDMGGTTAKVCLIQDHQPLVTGQFEIDRIYRLKEGSGLPVTVPCIDMIEIGAGGGSIAHVNELGTLNVGPRSVGSEPGPACYGRGGQDATVTDADVILGLIDPNKFLGGSMALDSQAAWAAIGKVASALGTDESTAARGVFRVVCDAMAAAVRAHAAERGVDYRGIPLLAFGGAGPVHACEVAELLNGSKVIFPAFASVYSAFGMLATPIRLDVVRTSLSRLESLDWSVVRSRFEEMEVEGQRALLEANCQHEDVQFSYAADMRYVGQHHHLTVDLVGRPDESEGIAPLRARFEDEYHKRYHLTQPDVSIEIVNWRVTATGPIPEVPSVTNKTTAPLSEGLRRVHLWPEYPEVRTITRGHLSQHVGGLQGPLLIEEADTTIVIPPGWFATLDVLDCVIAKRVSKEDRHERN